ncbi:MAG: helix-turn-helix transcriptional regulator [Gammaproteobacteria bacterium]|nr:helix-turn-helix transcriptional regulator [Gammaproteobacteria bacterium]
MTVNLPSTNHLFTLTKEMNRIAEPLFNHSEINLFYYLRYYDNNELLSLTTYSDWNRAVIESGKITRREKLLQIMNKKNNRLNHLHNTFYYSLQEDNPQADELGKAYGIGSKFALIDKQDEFIECFCFASRTMKNLTQFYFSHWDCLTIFKHYFLDQAKPLIEKAEKTKISLAPYLTPTTGIDENHSLASHSDHLHQALQPRHYHILYHGKRIIITSREFNCLKYLAQGRTLKETGKLLGISPRTAEDYLNRLKNKLVIHTKSQLIDLYLSTDLSILS